MCRQMVDREMRKIGLTRAQWYILNFVFLYEGATQQELADMLDLGKSAVAKQIATLQEKGWLYKGIHESDSRSFRVYLTEGMRPVVVKLNKLAESILSPFLDRLSSDEASTLIHLLRTIDLHLEGLNGNSSPSVQKLLKEIDRELRK